MAFFKFRKSGDEKSATPAQPESVEAMRKRAKYRLIGAAVLVLIGVIGFPLLFDKQPRPIAVDLPIDIPDKNKVKPLSLPALATSESAPVAKIEEKVASAPVVTAQEAPKIIANAEPKPVEKVTDKPVEKPTLVAATKPVTKPDDAAKALALLEGKEPVKTAATGEERYVVQIGAFADAAHAREARLKVEHAGLKTYTQVAETKDGRRIRVRVGPFASRAEADKAADKIKKINLPSAILTL
jgi:DedD protein